MKSKCFLALTLLSFKIANSQVPAYVPTNGLKGFWPFSNNALDISGNNNNGTVNGAVMTTDRFNVSSSAYSFNGTSDFISTNMTGILGNNPRAVSFWAKTTESLSTMAAVQWGDEQSFPNHGARYECGFNEGAAGPCIIGADCVITYSSSSNPHNNIWHHYVYQFLTGALNQVEIYQDGVLLTQTTYTHHPDAVLNTSNNWPVSFGHLPYTIPHYFKGALDEIGIWDRILTNCEIQELYTSAKTSVTIAPSNATICPGQSLMLTASGNVNTFLWNTGQGGSQINVSPGSTSQYSVTATNSVTGCETSRAVLVVVSPCTELNQFDEILTDAYPNPSTGDLTIEVNRVTDITITNTLGQKVSETEAQPGKNKLELRDLAEGVYTIDGRTQTTTWRRKIVITK